MFAYVPNSNALLLQKAVRYDMFSKNVSYSNMSEYQTDLGLSKYSQTHMRTYLTRKCFSVVFKLLQALLIYVSPE